MSRQFRKRPGKVRSRNQFKAKPNKASNSANASRKKGGDIPDSEEKLLLPSHGFAWCFRPSAWRVYTSRHSDSTVQGADTIRHYTGGDKCHGPRMVIQPFTQRAKQAEKADTRSRLYSRGRLAVCLEGVTGLCRRVGFWGMKYTRQETLDAQYKHQMPKGQHKHRTRITW